MQLLFRTHIFAIISRPIRVAHAFVRRYDDIFVFVYHFGFVYAKLGWYTPHHLCEMSCICKDKRQNILSSMLIFSIFQYFQML